MKMPFREDEGLYSMAFYLRFNGAANPVNTTVAVKLMDAEKNPDKYYKVTLSTTGEVTINENVQGQTFLFGTYSRSTPQVDDVVIDPADFSPIMFQGLWVR